jgi:hypothetical protein
MHLVGRSRRAGCLVFCTALLFGSAVSAQQAPQPAAEGPQGSVDAINYETAHDGRRLEAARAAGPIVLDGVLDEPSWRSAPMANNFVQKEPREGTRATYDTEVLALYDDAALYFGVFAHDNEPGEVIVNDLKKDFNATQGDAFTIVLDTFHDQRNGYKFATNPGGAKWDEQMANEGRENNSSWDGIWEVQTRVTETGWYAEIRIPFRTLKFREIETQTWGVNFERRVRRINEESYWAPLPRIYDLDRVSMAGTLENMRGIRPGRNIRLKPFALSSSNTVGGQPTLGDAEAGFDVKYGVTSGLTWDFTVNTDFSQVEADEQQINLTRFNLLFPEKRDFFLENSGIFQFGAPQRTGAGGATAGRQNQSQEPILFFSRRVGLSAEGDAVPILGGTRLTGRLGNSTIGVLNIQQRSEDAVPSTNFTAVRVRRDILANSDIGAIVLNKEENGAGYNRLTGVDAAFRFGLVNFSGYLAKTFSPLAAVGGSGKDLIGQGAGSYISRTWQVRGQYTTIGERFNDELGFVPRLGVTNTWINVRRSFRPRWIPSWMRELWPHWVLDMYRRPDGKVESVYQDFHFPFNTQSGSQFEAGFNPNLEDVDESFVINNARRATVGPGRHKFTEYFIYWNTNNSARFSYQSRYSTGEFYDGHRRSYVFGPSFKPNAKLNASAQLQVNDITLPGASYVSTLITSRLNYNFSTRMFVNALLQYNTDSRQWSSNLRFNIIHRPLSDFFLVYNERRDERTGTLINRAVIAKMTYLMAF